MISLLLHFSLLTILFCQSIHLIEGMATSIQNYGSQYFVGFDLGTSGEFDVDHFTSFQGACLNLSPQQVQEYP
jgi:hypothetical protein